MGVSVNKRKDINGDKIIIEGGTDGTSIGNLDDNLLVADIVDGAGVEGTITVGTTAIEAKVGGSALADRKLLSVQPKDNQIFYGYTSGVTTANGTQIFKDQTVWFDIGENATIYLIANGAGKDVRITEAS